MRGTSLIAGAVSCVLLAAAAVAQADQELPSGPNRALVYGQCRTCHDLQYLKESAGIPRDAWSDIIDGMAQYGLRIAPDQRDKILNYLATYLGPNPPPATASAPTTAPTIVDGIAVFHDQCVACHQANGEGVAGQFPPLAGNRDLFLDRDFPIYVVLFGIEGEIEVGGKNFNAVMPPFGHLSDSEVAAVINYVRGAWGNDKLDAKHLPAVKDSDVKAERDKNLTAAAVRAYLSRLH